MGMKKIGLFVFAFLLLFGAGAQQSSAGPRLINVQATAEMELVPDEVWVQVQLQEYDKKGAGKVNIEKISNNFLCLPEILSRSSWRKTQPLVIPGHSLMLILFLPFSGMIMN